MNTFVFTFYADRIAPYTLTIDLDVSTEKQAGDEFATAVFQNSFMLADGGEWVRGTAITSYKVKLKSSVVDEIEKARLVIANYLAKNGPAITPDSLLHVYKEYKDNMPIPDHVKAAVISNKNELEILSRKEEI